MLLLGWYLHEKARDIILLTTFIHSLTTNYVMDVWGYAKGCTRRLAYHNQ